MSTKASPTYPANPNLFRENCSLTVEIARCSYPIQNPRENQPQSDLVFFLGGPCAFARLSRSL